MGHLQMFPLFGDPSTGSGLWHFVKRGWDTVVFGTPAVIVFFVISGFCIHLPFRGAGQIDIPRYYLRRYIRILVPVAGALLVYRMLGNKLLLWGEHSILWHSPLWSLACEEIYYAIYPGLRWLRNALQWKILLPISFVLSVLVANQHPHALDWHVFNPLGTAFILLPVWLLGCYLAEQSESLRPENAISSIWLWRFLGWLGCWVSEMLHFKAGISYTQTMLWFGVFAFFWVRQEIIWGKTHSPNRYLVAGGAWSYSLYLVHAAGMDLAGFLPLNGLIIQVRWVVTMSCSLLFAYVFYQIVERPSHKLARKFKVRGAQSPAGEDRAGPFPIAQDKLPAEEGA